jgi:hypothetical protein
VCEKRHFSSAYFWAVMRITRIAVIAVTDSPLDAL